MLLLYTDAVVGELRHPVKLNFFPAISISLLLLPIAVLPIDPRVSAPRWLVGASLHLAFTRLSGEPDTLARFLYYAGLFLTLLLFTQIGRFAKLKFFLSWWAYSFPLAAISIACMVMYELSGVDAYRWIGVGLLLLLTAIVALLLVRTAIAVARHRICVPGH